MELWWMLDMAKKPADSTLYSWWRRVVRSRWQNRCALADEGGCSGPLECHHYVHKRFLLLRFDPENGILLCANHHNVADRSQYRRKIESMIDTDYIDHMQEYRDHKQYRDKHGLSENEWRAGMLQVLKDEAAQREGV